ncbi:Uncharacterised protein [uncultured archaeon]|nr:Uncharacterised protein [uncultured archaeon]
MYKFYIRKKQHIFFILFLIVTNIVVMLNIPIFRQAFGSVFLTFLPGFLILSILKLDDISQLKKIILTIGLSFSFLMFYGLLVNTFVLNLGYTNPLSKRWLLLAFDFVIIILYWINFIINKGKIITFRLRLNQRLNEKLMILSFIILFPSLSIFGAYLMRTDGNNIVLMFGFILIIFVVILMAIFNNKVPKNIYPFAIYSIGIFITFAFSLRSEYIVGADVHSEYYLFRVALNNLHWKIIDYSALDSCLSISLLPAIYQSILNISNIVFFYKLFYSIFIPIIPLAIYEISRKYIDDIFAFFAAIFFASSHIFMWTSANPRTNLAILFFVLVIMTLFTNIKLQNKKLLLLIFMLSMVWSHYTTTYISFFVLLGIWILIQIVELKYPMEKNISFVLVMVFFVIIFFWYSQVTVGAFDNSAIGFFEGTLKGLPQLFSVDSRGGALPEVMGKSFTYNAVPRQIHIINQWIVIIIIGFGIISMIVNFRKMMEIPTKQYDTPTFLRRKIEILYLLLAIACFGLLVSLVVIPQASIGLGTDRAYFQMMGVLSFIFIIGCLSISQYIKIKPSLIILLILIPYFMSNTGILYQLYDLPNEPTLSSKGSLYETYYIQKSDMKSAEWLSNNYNPDISIHFINSGGDNAFKDLKTLESKFSVKYTEIQNHQKIDGYLYLQHINIVKGIFINKSLYSRNFNISEYPEIFNVKSEIYDNGGSKIYI